MSALSTATASIHAALASLKENEGFSLGESERADALEACERLRAELQGPLDAVFDLTLVVSLSNLISIFAFFF